MASSALATSSLTSSMKAFCLLVALVALVKAEIDWSKVKPVELNPPQVVPFLRRPVPRITGGVEATPHSLPYQVGLFIPYKDGTAFCGGSLISPTTVLTAAHCGELSDRVEVVLGAHKIRQHEAAQVRVNSSKIILHPKWNRLTLVNDIAIIKLPHAVKLTDAIKLVKLPSKSDASNQYEGEISTVSGWGKSSDTAQGISEALRKIEVPVTKNSKCNVYYLGVIQDTHICTTGDGGKSTCSGDSGGPLVTNGVQTGVVSFGISLGCEIGWPAVYTRVTKYLDWIQEHSDVVIS